MKRHGLLIQRSVGDALAASGRFEILTEVRLPITEAAHDLLTSENSDRDLEKIKLKADWKFSAWWRSISSLSIPKAAGPELTMSSAATGRLVPQACSIEFDLRATRLILPSFLAKCGYEGIRSVTSAVIDYYGASGFSKEMRLTKEELDGHFGVPVIDTIDAMTAELQRALHAEMRNLLMPALTNMPHAEAPGAEIIVPPLTAETAKAGIRDNAIGRVLNARPTGPGPWRARMA